MTKDEALKLALEFIENSECGTADLEARIKEALAQPEQKPMAWKLPDKNVVFWEDTKEVDEYHGFEPTIPLYPHPQRTWVGLTRAERFEIEKAMSKYYDYQHECKTVCLPEFAAAIEAKLKEKNT